MYRIPFVACLLLAAGLTTVLSAQTTTHKKTLALGKQVFELHNVTGAVIQFEGKPVLKIERDLTAIPFDSTRVQATVDEPHFATIAGLDDFENGSIEVKMYSQLQNPAPYSGIAGFIGVCFKVQQNDSAFECIYVRPKVGRIQNQLYRNHAVQYISYPQYKFDSLRKIAPYQYEGSAPVALNEWITMRIEVNGQTAEMFINNQPYSSFIVHKMLGKHTKGGIALYVDIGTIGYFKDVKITKKALKVTTAGSARADKI
ncbi:MAG: hypothetical protein RL172_29 [Bacteroidota bacterium]